MHKKIITLLIFLLALISAMNSYAEEFSVIVNKSNSISSIDQKSLYRIFLMKKKNWDNGDIILPVNLKEYNETRKEFSIKILRKSAKNADKYYLKKALAGKGQPPKVFALDAEVIGFVSWNVGAIGYVSKPDSSVKVITVK